MRVAAKLLEAVDGALAHHWFSTKRSVVDDLQHDGRRVHLIFGEKLGDTQHSTWNIQSSSTSGWRCRAQAKNGYHFEEQNRSGEVGVLFEVLDDRRLNDFTATFHDQTGG